MLLYIDSKTASAVHVSYQKHMSLPKEGEGAANYNELPVIFVVDDF